MDISLVNYNAVNRSVLASSQDGEESPVTSAKQTGHHTAVSKESLAQLVQPVKDVEELPSNETTLQSGSQRPSHHINLRV